MATWVKELLKRNQAKYRSELGPAEEIYLYRYIDLFEIT